MKLAEYLEARGLTCLAFADKATVDPTVITRFVRGSRGLNLLTAQKIVKATGGRVSFNDLCAQAQANGSTAA